MTLINKRIYKIKLSSTTAIMPNQNINIAADLSISSSPLYENAMDRIVILEGFISGRGVEMFSEDSESTQKINIAFSTKDDNYKDMRIVLKRVIDDFIDAIIEIEGRNI